MRKHRMAVAVLSGFLVLLAGCSWAWHERTYEPPVEIRKGEGRKIIKTVSQDTKLYRLTFMDGSVRVFKMGPGGKLEEVRP